MDVLVTERGDRPDVLTKARVIAPQAAKFFADRMHEQKFADRAVIVLDWLGDYHWEGDGPMPEELRLPAMYIYVEKWYPQIGERLTTDLALDIEDMFGRDEAKADDLEEVGQLLAEKVRSEEKRRGLNA